MARVLQLRNQIAHHEAIFGRNLSRDYEVMMELVALIDSEAHEYIASISKVEPLLRVRSESGARSSSENVIERT